MNPMSVRAPTVVSWKPGDGVPDQFPVGLRVLVVDDDPTCLFILENMLKKCLYQVTKCNRAEAALKLLRDNRDGYDVVISDVHMPDMDGFKLLEHIGLEMDLPVIMMSADDSKSVVMKGVTHGACDYLIKPVSMEALKNIWQHVVRKKKHEKDSHERQSGSVEDGECHPKTSDDTDNYSSANEGNNWKSCSRKRKDGDEDEGDEKDDSSAMKKPRVVWSVELHQQFVTAVNQLGIDKAVPKKILELMNVPGLTRENVASHLQKYRLYLKRVSVGQQQNMYGNPFMGPTDPTFGTFNGLDFQGIASSSQLPPQSLATIQAGRAVTNRPGGLADHRNIFSFESPRNNNQVNLLPTNVNLSMHGQLGQLHPSNQLLSRPDYRNPMIPNMGMGRIGNDIGRVSNPQLSSSVDLSSSQRTITDNTNAFSLVANANAGMMSTTSNSNSNPNHNHGGLFNNIRNVEWGLQGRGPTFEGQRVDVAPSVLVQPGFLSEQRSVNNNKTTNVGQQQQVSLIKPERVSDMGGFQSSSSPLLDQFGHDDLLYNAFFKQTEEELVAGDFRGLDGGYHLDNLPV